MSRPSHLCVCRVGTPPARYNIYKSLRAPARYFLIYEHTRVYPGDCYVLALHITVKLKQHITVKLEQHIKQQGG